MTRIRTDVGCAVHRAIALPKEDRDQTAIITIICINPGALEHNREGLLAQLAVARGPSYPAHYTYNVETLLGIPPDIADSIGDYYDSRRMTGEGIVCMRLRDLLDKFYGKIPACDALWCTRTVLDIIAAG